MIPRLNRFKGHRSVSRVRGRTVHGARMSIRYASSRPNDASRLAVVVSKKVDNRAVVRNRIRRRLYEAIRTQELLPQRGLDVVVYVKQPGLAKCSAADMHRELEELFSKFK